jgi:hypothetical protein
VAGFQVSISGRFWVSTEALASELRDQVSFHTETARVSAALERRLGTFGVVLFVMTAIGVAADIYPYAAAYLGGTTAWPKWFARSLPVMTGTLPALGGAIAAVASHAELRRIARRSLAMNTALRRVVNMIEDQLDVRSSLTFERTYDLLNTASRAMVGEVLEWRVIFKDRNLAETLH